MSNIKIGTLTFHWATNYGAVIQAYALQKCIGNLGYNTEIIDYVPWRIKFINTISSFLKNDIIIREQEKNIEKFRDSFLRLSNTRFLSSRALRMAKEDYSHIFVGSDQIWNYSFTMGAEKKPTLNYFLNFAGENVKKISYAASFGFDIAPHDYVELVKPYISKFSSISVRENTGLKICNQLGVDAELICDPTLLLERADYESFFNSFDESEDEFIFSYILHGKENSAKEIIDKIKSEDDIQVKSDKGEGIECWLKNINNAKVVVTNSFHGMLFCLVFNTPFIVIPVKGSTMNDRIETVLTSYNLMDRIANHRAGLPSADIDWNHVNQKLKEEREKGIAFIQRTIS